MLRHAEQRCTSRCIRSSPSFQPSGSQRVEVVASAAALIRASSSSSAPVARRASPRSSSTTSAGALATKPSLRELALAALDLGAQLLAALLEPRRDRVGVDLLRGEHLDRADARRSARRRPRVELDAGPSAADELVRLGAVGAGAPARCPAGTPTRSRQRRSARVSAIAALDLGLGRRRRRSASSALGKRVDHERLAARLGQVGPDLLGDERHHRVGSASTCSSAQSRVAEASALAVVEARLDDLQVPVAELRPEERRRGSSAAWAKS